MSRYLNDKQLEFLIEYMIEFGVMTQKEYELVCSINGWSYESVLDILYVRTSLRNLEQFLNEFGLEKEYKRYMKRK